MEHTRSQKIRWLVVSLLIVIAQLTPRYGARTPRARSALKARDIASSTHLIIFAGLLLAVLMVTFGPASLRAVYARSLPDPTPPQGTCMPPLAACPPPSGPSAVPCRPAPCATAASSLTYVPQG